jgi:two-component system response regulator HydG
LGRLNRWRYVDAMARILVVDDQPELAELIQAVLEGDGHAVEAVLGGQAALERLSEHAYDLVVCDLQMPDIDGAAVYRAAEQLAPPRPAMLLMTGFADAPTYEDFLRTTWGAVLAKPVGIDALRERVRHLLEDR